MSVYTLTELAKQITIIATNFKVSSFCIKLILKTENKKNKLIFSNISSASTQNIICACDTSPFTLLSAAKKISSKI